MATKKIMMRLMFSGRNLMKRKIIALTIISTIIFSLLFVQDVSAIVNLPTGSGTVDNPFILMTPNDFNMMQCSDRYFKLGANITNPDEVRIFSGVLDGGGYTITNTTGWFIGFMDDATVINLTVQASISESKDSGIPLNYEGFQTASAIACRGSGTFERCIIKGNINSSEWGKAYDQGESSALSAYAGGLAGTGTFTIIRCRNEANISFSASQAGGKSNSTPHTAYIGGLIGRAESGTISECANTGTVTSYNTFTKYSDDCDLYTGGIAGYLTKENYNADNAIMYDCYNTGTVTSTKGGKSGTTCYANGVVGASYQTRRVSTSYSTKTGSQLDTKYCNSSCTKSTSFSTSATNLTLLGWDMMTVWVVDSTNGGQAHLRWEDSPAATITLVSPQYDVITKESSFYSYESIQNPLYPPLKLVTGVLSNSYEFYMLWYSSATSITRTIGNAKASGVKVHCGSQYSGKSEYMNNNKRGYIEASKDGKTLDRTNYSSTGMPSGSWSSEFPYGSLDLIFSGNSSYSGSAPSADALIYNIPNADVMEPKVTFRQSGDNETLSLKYSVRDYNSGVYKNTKGAAGNLYVDGNGEGMAGVTAKAYDTVSYQLKVNATDLPDGYYAMDIWTESGVSTKSNVVTVYYNILRIPPYQNISIDPILSSTELKSGYGFTATVTVRIDTNIEDEDDIAVITKVLAYFPDDHYTNGHELVKVSSDRMNYIWEFPVSAKSKIGAKKWYVPVGFPDKTYYTVKFKAETSKSEVYAEQESSILIDGNMYEDFRTQAVYNSFY